MNFAMFCFGFATAATLAAWLWAYRDHDDSRMG